MPSIKQVIRKLREHLLRFGGDEISIVQQNDQSCNAEIEALISSHSTWSGNSAVVQLADGTLQERTFTAIFHCDGEIYSKFIDLAYLCSELVSIQEYRALGLRSAGSECDAWIFLLFDNPVVAPRLIDKNGALVLSDPALASLDVLISRAGQSKERLKVIAPAISVMLEPPQVVLNGLPYSVTPEGARLVHALVEANGEWVSGEKLELRPDKVKKSLPRQIRSLVEAAPGKGQRIPVQNRTEPNPT